MLNEVYTQEEQQWLCDHSPIIRSLINGMMLFNPMLNGLLDAQKRLKGAGMLGGKDDLVNEAVRMAKGERI